MALAGRTALVTGAGNGLGRAMALQLAKSGVRTLLAGRTRTTLEASAELVEQHGMGTRIVAVDVASEASVAEMSAEIGDEDVSILVNNAGVAGPVAAMAEISVADWDEVFAVNVRGTFLMSRALVPAMIARGSGDVVNVASVTGKRPLEGRTPYAASKLAVIGFTRTLAAELGSTGVRVNALSPGPVRGPRMEANFRREAERTGISPEQAEANYADRAAQRRLIEAEEVGAALVSMLTMTGLCGADIDLSAGMIAPA